MVVIGFISAVLSTAAHAVTCDKSCSDRTAGAIPWAMTSSPYDDYAPCTNGFPHRQCAHGYCGMCRFERRRERRYERRAERDLDRAAAWGHSCRSSRRGRCPCGVAGGSFVVLPSSAVPTSDPDWNARRMAGPQYQQEQGVQSAESLASAPVERPTVASPPAYEYLATEKPERFFQ
ncbi:hypothetical protein B0T11DRAFT_292962 [Plectosphaerella cucumerina]|jgi:hypothetical protein|uniref:Secreted protein n=1 Tax=Plectosphaerella cucumerina TaxID=40658 RepID=A0A8K0X9R8_9PEZI|nr:hypothetical protein B0T11DRAFT_292962 [Plectosphaerella cucumerina]